DQTVSADPNVIVCLWQLRNDVAAEVIGNDHLREFGRKVGRFRYDPHPRFWLACAGDQTTNICLADRYLTHASLLSTEWHVAARKAPGDHCDNHPALDCFRFHKRLLLEN